MTQRSLSRVVFHSLALFCATCLVYSEKAWGQGGGGGAFNPPIAGIEINADGVLRVHRIDARLNQQRMMAAAGKLAPDLAKQSKLRKVSLNRLEAAIADRASKGENLTDDMRAFAGLTGIEFVFFYPESGDIVLAGPAEGFAEDAAGVTRGVFTGRPTVLLEDLVVALRAFAPATSKTNVISVSIDPTQEGLQRMNRFLSSLRGNANALPTDQIAAGLKNNLGYQTVTFQGVSPATHFARVLVEADYRMKLVGIGLERLPVNMKSYVERAAKSSVAANSMERWYFVPNYECVRVSEDGFAMQLVGDGVKLIGENERVANNGQRVASAKTNAASQAFCKDFTDNYPKIAESVAVYGQLKNLIDLSIAAAFIRQQDYCGQAGWNMDVLGDEGKLPTEVHNVPHQVETAVNAIWVGNKLLTPLGGGINMQPRLALKSDMVKQDEGAARSERAAQDLGKLAEGQWWWD